MEKIARYCSWADAQVLSNKDLCAPPPSEILEIIRASDDTRYLDALAEATLIPHLTDQLFILYEPIIVDIAARWAYQTSGEDAQSSIRVLACFARILPAKPCLKVPLQTFLTKCNGGFLGSLAGSSYLHLLDLDIDLLSSFLLALFRLYSHDIVTYGNLVSPVQLSSLLRLDVSSVRHLAIRCLALYMKLADATVEEMISTQVPANHCTIKADRYESPVRLFSLGEEQRWKNIEEGLSNAQYNRGNHPATALRSLTLEMLSSQTAIMGDILLPRDGSVPPAPSFVTTPTTTRNFHKLAKALLDPNGILLTGASGSGKTLLVTEAAKMLNKLPSMITLHLNEQTDAKNLLGTYTTSSTDGSFIWQAGVLTRAMQEGRWVLVEDIHRAPSEVMGVLLPILEHGQILITNRNEMVRATTGFRILATTTEFALGKGSVTTRSHSRLNLRLWNIIEVEPLAPSELQMLVSKLFPILESHILSFLLVHSSVQQLFEHTPFKISGSRRPDLRDLLKWCHRSQLRLKAAGLRTGSEPVDESIMYNIFEDAVSCYASHNPRQELHFAVASCIAKVLQIPEQRMRHCIYEHSPSLREDSRKVSVGRASYPVIKSYTNGIVRNTNRPKSAFALTRGTLKTMEEIATAVQYAEPTLLVGETGIGKTAVIQHLATLVGQKLSVFNLSQQSESGDLLGGFKPITTRSLAIPMSEKFDVLFDNTFSHRKNAQFQASTHKCVLKGNWTRLISHWQEAVEMADKALRTTTDSPSDLSEEQPNKRRRLQGPKYEALRLRWRDFAQQLSHFRAQVSRGDKNFAFAFVEGKIVQALRNGEWVLLDEVNLATPETLESIADLLCNPDERVPSLLLSESGKLERVEGHPNFRIFSAMNPATDTGKRELPPALRTRFTEIYVQPSDGHVQDLTLLISTYLGTLLSPDKKAALDLATCYLEVQKLNEQKRLTDGAGQLPHFSIRSLVRTLIYANQHATIYGLRRALYEGFLMSFTTMLSIESERLVRPLVEGHLFSGVKNALSVLKQKRKIQQDDPSYVTFRHHLVKRGNLPPEPQPHYIITPFVERNLLNLARAVSLRRFPILLQGPTSAGKTSMVEYLAKISGNEFIRINNHEHTDLQEYLGSYVSGEDGKLQYREGVLVEALRRGHWVVLDELNLAPTDVLEALNRLLDDNRELFIPETQEVVKPHPNFVLFATQNPAGLYGGRKHLSRAFRNRFLELHFDDIPENELEFILKERTQIAPSYCTKIVAVYKRLSMMRQASRLFEQRNSFATLRDLFRWASRRADDRNQLAVNGLMLLAERVRDQHERIAVKHIIEDVMNVQIDEAGIYPSRFQAIRSRNVSGLIWTPAMQRLLVLVMAALENNEPVLLVGETGCGKTQICQTVADITGQHLHMLNAHSNTETGDLIGAQRPVRNKAENEQSLRLTLESFLINQMNGTTSLVTLEDLITQFDKVELSGNGSSSIQDIKAKIAKARSLFEWADGSLVVAMKRGELFLLDEISLAEDSVLERLNSVLEPSRSILLAEKAQDDSFVRAASGFQFLATMNPGGDYGKRELSSALRNRLTEIWVPPLSEQVDVLPILESRLGPGVLDVPGIMIEFARWFRDTFYTIGTTVSLRELLTWVDFVRLSDHQDLHTAIVHGAALVFIDSLGANPAALTSIKATDIEQCQQACLQKLAELLHKDVSAIYFESPTIKIGRSSVQCGNFSISRSTDAVTQDGLVFEAPTTRKNALRVLRALQLSRPILIEGDPGVGKTALVEGISQAAGKQLTRINLSDQTDLMDLFGSDVPVEGNQAGNFSWRDGPLLQAMQKGDWVLLDEINLASQSVLEGLNSCFDHRQQVYIAELDRTFVRHPDFVLFATQNPHHQGGGRKGLPASFVNRFTVVYADALNEEDLMIICRKKFKEVNHSALTYIISTISKCRKMIQDNRSFDSVGGPWEVNLRDIGRWLSVYKQYDGRISPQHFQDLIISQQFRTHQQKNAIREAFNENLPAEAGISMFNDLSTWYYQLGIAFLERRRDYQPVESRNTDFPPHLLPYAQSLIHCVNEKWPAIVVGESGSGKSTLVRELAAVRGTQLVEFSVTEDMDTIDLIGGFEQLHQDRAVSDFAASLVSKILPFLSRYLAGGNPGWDLDILLQTYELCVAGKVDLQALHSALCSVSGKLPSFKDDVHHLERLVADHANTKEAHFGWHDGVVVDAVERGHWLVLDNVNTCNPAVLDRLNSLLEPVRQLIISEQHQEGGRPRVVRAHDDFRLFLTMVPSRGELSRAMRNRSVEIYLDSGNIDRPVSRSLAYPTEAATFHWRRLQSLPLSQYGPLVQRAVAAVCVDHMSPNDLTAISPRHYSLLASQFNEQIIHEYNCYQLLPQSLFTRIQDFYVKVADSFPVLEQIVRDQPLHAESNEPLLQLASSGGLYHKAARSGWLLESSLILCRIRKFLSDAVNRAASLPLAEMTVLEKSKAAQMNQSLLKDKAQPVWGLIQALLIATDEVLNSITAESLIHQLCPVDEVDALLAFLKDILDVSSANRLRSGLLSTYLDIGKDLFAKTSLAYPTTAKLVQDSLRTFGEQIQLRYGQSLSRLWKCWRPRCAADSTQLDSLLKLDAIMEAFDIHCRRVSFVPQMDDILVRLVAARDSILKGSDNIDTLLTDLQSITFDLEHSTPAENDRRRSYFAHDFEGLCQYHDLEPYNSRDIWSRATEKSTQAYAALLAGRDTITLSSLVSSNQGSATLSSFTSFAGWQNHTARVESWKGTFGQEVLKRLDACRSEPLDCLDSLTEETLWLSRAIMDCTRPFGENQLERLGQLLMSLICDVLTFHQDLFKHEVQGPVSTASGRPSALAAVLVHVGDQDIFHENVPNDHYFRRIWRDFLHPALYGITSKTESNIYRRTGASLVSFALASLQMWIPDKPTDPAIAVSVQRDRHRRKKLELNTKLQALKIFESHFHDQSTSLRIRNAEHGIALLGQEPPPPPVVRLKDDNLMQLQTEFSNILNGIVTKEPEFSLLSSVDGPFRNERILPSERSRTIEDLRRNIEQMVRRLSGSAPSYNDLTTPVVQLLQTLDLGARMIEWSERDIQLTEISRSLIHIADHTPLLGATPASLFEIVPQNCLDESMTNMDIMQLETASLVVTLGSWSHLESPLQSAILSAFESCYVKWKAHLSADQAKEAKKAKYYEYRDQHINDTEINPDEVQKIFPTFDRSDTTMENVEKYDSKSLAVRVADLQADIFAPRPGNSQLKHHLLHRLRSISSLLSRSNADDSLLEPVKMLPALFLLLEENLRFLNGAEGPMEYNIYADPSINEARKLLGLVRRIQDRVRMIKESWPEHAIPTEILACCRDIVQMRISDSIAKFLTKTEKLHSILNEWQAVASRQYTVLPLIEELASLIVSWRRMELSSWSRLLSEETSRCEDDAKSWWFVIYEVAISIPLRLVGEGQDYASHIEDLVNTLIKFFHATNLGHYSSRLRTLETFQKMAESLISSEKSMRAISWALSNIIEHFKRYEPAIQKRLTDERAKLEQEVKEQIKLASWKDTNVTTLRESARRSHYRLFKIVKKFRALLAKPIETFAALNVSQDRTELSRMIDTDNVFEKQAISSAARVVEQHFTDWADAPRRLRDPFGAAASMRQLYLSSQSDLKLGSELHDYALNLTSTMKELQSQTPSNIDDDNRSLVLHLKARKRRLLADVLRDVRHMGVRRNLHTQELERQSSVASILSTVTAIEISGTSLDGSNIRRHLLDARNHFHGFLDLVDRARKSREEHPEDLTSSEVGRCIGSLEGFLLLMQNQRNRLDDVLGDIQSLGRTRQKMYNLQLQHASDPVTLDVSTKSKQEQARCAALWLPQILEVACDVLDIQARYAKGNFTAVLVGLRSYEAQFTADREEMEGLSSQEWPLSLQSQTASAKIQSLQNRMASLHGDLHHWIEREPDTAYLLRQLVPWTDWSSLHTSYVMPQGQKFMDITGFNKRLLAAVDKIFIRMQNYDAVAQKLPNGMEDPGWLVRSEEGLATCIKSFCMKETAQEIEDVTSMIASFEEFNLQKMISLCIVFTPIIHQFHIICEHVVERYVDLHAETCKLAYVLVRSFNQIASEGFCGPVDGSGNVDESAGNLEQGTGLAEGKGAEDISKDVGDDEDLSELAQQHRAEEDKEEMENEENAVDMGGDDLQGEMDEHGAEQDEDDEKDVRSETGEDNVEEETGSVDHSDPGVVDEKLWDSLADNEEKKMQNEDGAGKSTKEQAAAQKSKDSPTDEEQDEDVDDHEGNSGQPEDEATNPHTQQQETLDLSDEMQLDGDQKAKEDTISDDGLDEFSDADNAADPDLPVGEDVGEEKQERDDSKVDEDSEMADTDEDANLEGHADEDEVMEDQATSEDNDQAEERQRQERQDDDANISEDVAAAETGASGEVDEKANDDEAGSFGKTTNVPLPAMNQEQQDTSGEDPHGGTSRAAFDRADERTGPAEKRQAEAFKKLGDVLERWHRQHREILPASAQEDVEQSNVDMVDPDFEHVGDEEDQGDSQALGAATKDQARALDENKALEVPPSQADKDTAPADIEETEESTFEAGLEQGQEERTDDANREQDVKGAAFIADSRGNMAGEPVTNGSDEVEDLDDVDHQVSNIDLSATDLQPLTSPEDALRLWSHYSSLTHSLSLVLTEQLRLILSPTQATKLRGDFRTGKRLNIKRIIPYIASQYKRDKIWMRRSIPSKRNYQIMIAVDDSKSMQEGSAHLLAFETLAILCKSLSMLEAGEVCVVSFGDCEHVRIAHGFGTPFTNDAGAKIYQNFGFQQNGTNVKKLIQESIQLFREARVRGSQSVAELWQLQLIISDGIHEEHDLIRRLVRQAIEERIMIVFVIVDSHNTGSGGGKGKGNSILDLTQAVFEPEEGTGASGAGTGEMKLKMKRYLDGFPFPYYVVVREVADLPGVLATALKGWFREVVDVR